MSTEAILWERDIVGASKKEILALLQFFIERSPIPRKVDPEKLYNAICSASGDREEQVQ